MGKPETKRPIVRPGYRWYDIIMDLEDLDKEALTELIWLRKGTCERANKRQRNVDLHKIRGISRMAENPSDV